VLEQLGLAEGAILPWSAVVGRVAAGVRGGDLPRICTTCPWLGLGLCASAMDRLAKDAGGKAGPRE
jgi:hypothetical protein